jgi:hypothetical protein
VQFLNFSRRACRPYPRRDHLCPGWSGSTGHQEATWSSSKIWNIYYWSLSVVFVSASILAALRWAEDYHLFILGTLSFATASFGRMARRRRWYGWVRLHIIGMGLSYILMLTAFYVDNGKSLPLWKELPAIAYWILPSAVELPLIVNALLRHPLVRPAETGSTSDGNESII